MTWQLYHVRNNIMVMSTAVVSTLQKLAGLPTFGVSFVGDNPLSFLPLPPIFILPSPYFFLIPRHGSASIPCAHTISFKVCGEPQFFIIKNMHLQMKARMHLGGL